MRIRRMAMTVGLSLGMLAPAVMAAAQDATPEGDMGGMPMPEGCSVVAQGLINPRYVAVGDDGTIYVSEAGGGGDEAIVMPAETMEGEGGTPAADAAADTATPMAEDAGEDAAMMDSGSTRGGTGQVTAIAPDGTQSVLVSGLPSYRIGGPEVTGPAGIAVAPDGSVILAVGGSGPLTPMVDALEYENSVVSIDPASGEITLLADIGAYERANNPDPYNIDSNLYGVAVGDDGTIFVNDAGGNATYRIPAGGGEPEVLAVHPGLELPEGMEGPPGGNPGRGGEMALDPVPTDVIAGADGGVLVGLLSGGPFPAGAAKIVSVSADGTIADVAGGLTMVVAIAAGPDGQLYATQISTNFLGEMPAPGNVLRVSEDGTQEIVVDGLMLPNGIAFEADGSLLVTMISTSPPGEPMGMLLRCDIGAAPAAGAPALDVARIRGFAMA